MKILIRMIALLVIAGLAVPAVAEEFSAPAGKRPWNLGAGAVYREKAYDGFKDSKKTTPIPIILFEGERFFVRGSNLGWKFINTNPWEVSILAEWWADGYEDGDASILRGMSDRDPSLAVGGLIRWQPERFGLELTATTDAMSNSDGSQVRAMALFTNRAGPWFYTVNGGIVFADSDFNDYYYGVRNSEVDLTRGRTAYSADDETGIRLGGLLGYNASGSKWTFLGGARYDYLGDEVDDSSITENDYQYALFGGFTYAFGK
ncbi:MAG: MipA/OmpV family protein [Gammaproteobacteria bacterium]